MGKTISTVDFEIPGHSNSLVDFTSDKSILDADIVVFQPPSFPSSSGKASYNEGYSQDLVRATQHWHRELSTALEHGRTVFLVMGKHEVAQIYTGQKDFKGARTINYVRDLSNYEFLPVTLPSIVAKGGSEIVFKQHPAFSAFWAAFADYLSYESYIDGKISTPVFVTKTGDRPVGGVLRVGKGHLVLLPMIDYDHDKFVKTNAKTKKTEWTREAIGFGSRLAASLLGIDKALRGDSTRTAPPAWVSESQFVLADELRLAKSIGDTESQIAKFTAKRASLRDELASTVQLKDLLFETGKPLEDAVTSALQLLGYCAENFNDGILEFDQVIVSPEGARFIGECEGKDSNAVNIDKFRQLAENIQADLERDDVTSPAIGILFGNGYRLTMPGQRAEQFTVKCIESAKRGTILIRASDLYPVAKYLKENSDSEFAATCRQSILSAVGTIVSFPQIPNAPSKE
jgi:hypothetical protein